MAFFDYETCEPLRMWDRLEPRARDVDFDDALAARVHDPLWMLSRQWQMGEFQGEDTGSSVLAKLARRLTPVAGHQLGGTVEAEDLTLPIEARVERLPHDFPPIVRAQLGRQFEHALGEAAAAASPAPAVPFDPAPYRTLLRSKFGIEAPQQPADPVAHARARVDARARRTTAALAGRAIDGVRLHAAIVAAGTALPPALAAGTDPAHLEIVAAATRRFRSWFEALYPPPPAGGSAWRADQLEYQSACTVPAKAGDVRLTVAEHVTGRLDWFAFDQDTAANGTPASTTDVCTVIPAPARFAGMPNPRWWEFEDAAVDLGNFRAQATDLARIVVAEFALVYGNNWFVVPYHQPVGTLAEIEGVVVTDTFGHQTFVGPAVPASTGAWTSWDLFSLSPRGTTGVAPVLGQHLFLPPTLGHVLDGEPYESVTLVRDEAANMVWGVERRIRDGLGGSRDGIEAARQFTDALSALLEPPPAPPPADGAAPPAPQPLRYRLGTEVSESWIPFIPVHIPGSSRAIRLQRGAMPRFLGPGEEPELVRPRTSILRQGLPAATDDITGTPPAYFLDEEEVPRTGVSLHGALRRARWLDGQTVIWHARTVSSGRGEVDSGLRFDVVEPVDPR